MAADPEACRPLTLADVGPAANVLAQAFIDDPLCAYMLPLRRTRRGALATYFRLMGELSIQTGRAYGAGQPLAGVAYWKTPEQAELSISLRSLGKLLPLLLTPYPLGLLRARAVVARLEQLHRQHADQPHFYLDNLGVLAEARGRGLASRLIRPFLARADAQGAMAYTDTVTPANVGLYEHFGFVCVEASPVAGTDLTVFALRRPAREERHDA
jgi:ribosomal protein S18 acetylase RimI-like enzyme